MRPSISKITSDMTNQTASQELVIRFPLSSFQEHVSIKDMWPKGGRRAGE